MWRSHDSGFKYQQGGGEEVIDSLKHEQTAFTLFPHTTIVSHDIHLKIEIIVVNTFH